MQKTWLDNPPHYFSKMNIQIDLLTLDKTIHILISLKLTK